MGKLKCGLGLILMISLTACATSVNLLTEEEVGSIRIARIDVAYAPNAAIWWGKAEREYAEKELAVVEAMGGKQRKRLKVAVSFEEGAPPEQDTDSRYLELVDSPAAKAYARAGLTKLIKDSLAKSVLPKFKGQRAAVLEITVHNFFIPSAVQRVVLGGSPTLSALRVLKDAKSGKVLAKLDQGAAAIAGQGVLGVALDQAFSDLENRVMAIFAEQTLAWLLKK